MHHWKAEVTVTGVPRITGEEVEDMQSVIKGVILRNPAADELELAWFFANGSPYIWDAIGHATSTWNTAVGFVESAVDPVCTDFRVRRVWPEKEDAAAGAELKKIFED